MPPTLTISPPRWRYRIPVPRTRIGRLVYRLSLLVCRAVCSVFLFALLSFVIFHALVFVVPFPRETDAPPIPCTFLEDRTGIPLAAFVPPDELGASWHVPVTQEQVPPHLLHAIVAVEDQRFYTHSGIDYFAVANAAWQNLMCRRIVRGASTITMQVWRLRDPQRRSFDVKLTQAFRAAQLERRYSKDEILLEYVNRAPFGGNLVGAGAASWRYFGRPVRELSLGQAALLAGLPQSPNRFRPDRKPQAAAKRRQYVLDRMLACGFITSAQHAQALQEPLDAAWHPLPQDVTPAAPPTSEAGALAGRQSPVANGGFPALCLLGESHPCRTTRTTLDAHLQQQVCQATLAHLRLPVAQHVRRRRAAGHRHRRVPRHRFGLAGFARSGPDPPAPLHGFMLKPFIYAAAFDAGQYAPTSILEDSPHAWAGYVPANFDRRFRARAHGRRGPGRLPQPPGHAGTGQDRPGPHDRPAPAAGIPLARPAASYGLALAIGGAEASPLQLAEAYSCLARDGTHIAATLVLPPTRMNCQLPITHCQLTTSSAILPAWVCRQTLAAIAEPDRTRALCPEAVSSHVAWKTGTSSGFRDAWCAAVTRRYTLVVWLGDTSAQPSPNLTGLSAAAPLALSLIAALESAHPQSPLSPWTTPSTPLADQGPSPATPIGNRQSAVRNPLSLLSPAPNQTILLHADQPAQLQRVALQSTGGTAPHWWFLDDQPLGQTADAQTLYWPPTPGPHTLRLVDAQGRALQTTLQVRTH